MESSSLFIKGFPMIISSISSSNYVAPAPLTQSIQPSQVSSTSDPDGDGDGGGARKARRGGGQMQNALMQALQSLGLSMPQQPTGTTASAGSTSTGQISGATDNDGDAAGSTAAAGSVKKDLRHFMQALFQAVKGETASTTPSTGTSSTDPKTNFAAGLTALITQVSNGSAPADLQSAFAKVAADLQQTGATPTVGAATGSDSTISAASSPQVTLQALLTQLQQNLGYGTPSSSAALGNLLSMQA
jgi:hypothetical protein